MSIVWGRVQRSVLSYDNAEALKWVAFASMLVDHLGKVFGWWEWALPLGRVAFPVFAFLIGRHLLSKRLFGRLLLVGVLASWPHAVALTGGEFLPLNILFTFAAAAAAVAAWERGRWEFALLAAGFAVFFCDYSLPGFLLVVSSWAWWESRSRVAVALLAAALGMLCVWNGNAWALLSVPLVAFASVQDWRVPRVRHFFWIAYPVHLAVVAVVVTFLL